MNSCVLISLTRTERLRNDATLIGYGFEQENLDFSKVRTEI